MNGKLSIRLVRKNLQNFGIEQLEIPFVKLFLVMNPGYDSIWGTEDDLVVSSTLETEFEKSEDWLRYLH